MAKAKVKARKRPAITSGDLVGIAGMSTDDATLELMNLRADLVRARTSVGPWAVAAVTVILALIGFIVPIDPGAASYYFVALGAFLSFLAASSYWNMVVEARLTAKAEAIERALDARASTSALPCLLQPRRTKPASLGLLIAAGTAMHLIERRRRPQA